MIPRTGSVRRGRFARMIALVVLPALGCAAAPYHYGRFHPQEPTGRSVEPVEIVYGKPHKTLDRMAWVIGLPNRILTLNKNTDNHKIAPETVEQLKVYLAENDITDVYVAVNDYDPKGQWKRLIANERIAPFWRYSAGVFTWLGYTCFPNRVFGGDRYDPYANTLNLSSDVPAVVLSEAAYAKDIHSQRYPGAYAAIVNDLPVLSVWRKTRAANDVLGYASVNDDWHTEEEAYQVLYPQIGAAAFGTAAPFVPTFGPLLTWGGAAAGHVTGRTVAYIQRPKAPTPAEPEDSEGPIQANYSESQDENPDTTHVLDKLPKIHAFRRPMSDSHR